MWDNNNFAVGIMKERRTVLLNQGRIKRKEIKLCLNSSFQCPTAAVFLFCVLGAEITSNEIIV